jgi:ABC-type antimicrobial peptide transport system permease subunit
MLKNYLIIAIRNLLKKKSYVIINMFGLGIALACCITSYILVAYNIEFDHFHRDKLTDQVYRLHAQVILNGGDKKEAIGAPHPIAPTATADFTGIDSFLRFAGNATGGVSVSYQNEEEEISKTFSENVVFADSTLFDMFNFPLVKGNHDAFKEQSSVFIDENIAIKYFGDEDPIGKIFTMGFSRGVQKQFVVGGVIKKIPLNSSIYLPIVIRFEHFEELRAMDQPPWGDWNVPATFFLLEDPESANQTAKLFDKFLSQRNDAFKEQEVTHYSLEPFHSKLDRKDMTWSYLNVPIEIEPLIIFVVLAFMILLIACFNLTNTSIAMTTSRLKEIGIRKSLGAHRKQIMTQLMLETLLVIILSLLVGYAMSKIIVPEFTTMWGLPYGMSDLSGINLVITLLVLVFLAAIMIGLYPSYFGTKFHTVFLLKGNIKVKGTSFLTRALVSTQFALSIIVLIAGIIFIQNTNYQEGIEFGYEKEKLLSISIQDPKAYDRIQAKALQIPNILQIGATEHQVGQSTYPNPITYKETEYEVNHLEFGENYFETMNFSFVHGRPIDFNRTSDFNEAAVVTEQFVKVLGMQDKPIGEIVNIRGKKKRIVGVIKDFVDNIYVSTEPVPFIFYATIPERWRQIVVRAEAEDLKIINKELEAAWGDLYPTKPYISRFQEDVLLEGMKQTNRNMQKIFIFLTILGGCLSGTGIYSLASLNIARRKKEIGIRKALGANVKSIMLLLNKEFVIILILAGLVGAIGGYFGTAWLMDLIYAYRIPISLMPILSASFLIFLLFLILLTVSWMSNLN